MSDELLGTLIVAVIAAVPPSLLAYFAFLQSRRVATIATASKLEMEEVKSIAGDLKIELKEVALKVDGRFDKLVEDIRTVAHAEGRAEGVLAITTQIDEEKRVVAQSAADRAEGLAEGRAETRLP